VAQPDLAGSFVIARNPDSSSKLTYLIRLPLTPAPLILKAGDSWPRTAKVYCHREQAWPEPVEIVDTVPVRECRRRGVAIDLVLERARENRSQFVFTRLRDGREAIFWQSPRTTAKARPGLRVPTRRASGQTDLVILVDTRERYAFKFARQQAHTEHRALPAGDYGVALDDEIIGVVERKSLPDLAGSLVDGSLTYALAELATVGRAALVVEERYSGVFKLPYVKPGFVAELLAAAQVRYPTVPIVFCETRALAEEWTFRYMGAALTFALSERDIWAADG
jgi:hypothetical protein